MNAQAAEQSADIEEPEGFDSADAPWDEYPLDAMLIRNDHRTVRDAVHRIKQNRWVMNPEFQRAFIWDKAKQSKLVESVIMRIPLPVFYMAEDAQGRMVVVDGLQRLTTFRRFVENELELHLPKRSELHGKQFRDLHPGLQNRVEDCNLIFYSIDSKAPERAKLDIFERVNSGEPLTRQQMRNCLHMGPATTFLREEAETKIFLQATGPSLKSETMRDREFVNRFCAFHILRLDTYRGDMDEFLAESLRQMNGMDTDRLSELSTTFRRSMSNNFLLFGRHAFRKHEPGQEKRRSLNVSFWDVMSTGLAHYSEAEVKAQAGPLRKAIYRLFEDENFNAAITSGTSDQRKVRTRFKMAKKVLGEVLGDHAD